MKTDSKILSLIFLLECATGLVLFLFIFKPDSLVYGLQWLIQTCTVSTLFLLLQLKAVRNNFNPVTKEPYKHISTATYITLIRGYFICLISGFIFNQLYQSALIWIKWMPGLLFVFAGILDYADGYVARKKGQVSQTGEILENYIDTFGLIAAPVLAVSLKKLPIWYLSIITIQFLVRFFIFYRKKQGKIIHPVKPRSNARVIAGIQMGFVGIALLPLFDGNILEIAAIIIVISAIWEFLLDYFYASGHNELNVKLTTMKQAFDIVLLVNRIVIFSLLVFSLKEFSSINVSLFLLSLPVLIGFLPRFFAIIFSIIIGLNSHELNWINMLLLLSSSAFVFGPGRFITNQVEENLLMRKLGAKKVKR